MDQTPPLVPPARLPPPPQGDAPGPVPGLLLVFPDKEIEQVISGTLIWRRPPLSFGLALALSCTDWAPILQEFRHFQSEYHYSHDIWWSLCIVIIVVRGCLVGQTLGWYLCVTEVALSTALLVLQLGLRTLYLRHRPRILTITRLARLAAVFFLFLPRTDAEDTVWPLFPDAASCATSMLFSQLHKITFIISRSVALPVPVKYSLGIQVLSLGIMLAFVPRRCASYLVSEQALDPGDCSLGAVGKLRALGVSGVWVINLALPEPPLALDASPLAACAAVQAALITVLGFLAPVLVAASLEEHRRLEWAENEWGGSPLRPPLAIRLIYDAVFMVMGTLIAANAARIFPWYLV